MTALNDPDFAGAVPATGRRNPSLAGVTNDVCTVHPTMTAPAQASGVLGLGDIDGFDRKGSGLHRATSDGHRRDNDPDRARAQRVRQHTRIDPDRRGGHPLRTSCFMTGPDRNKGDG